MGVILMVGLRLKPGEADKFMSLLAKNAIASRSEPGCRQFEVLVDMQDSLSVTLFEVYDDERAFEAHQQTEHFKRYFAEAVPLLESRVRHFVTRFV